MLGFVTEHTGGVTYVGVKALLSKSSSTWRALPSRAEGVLLATQMVLSALILPGPTYSSRSQKPLAINQSYSKQRDTQERIL